MPIFPNQYPEKLNPKATDKLLLSDGESNNAIKSVQAEKISSLVCPFPVGSIYMSVDGADPSTIWAGTTWSAFAQGKTIVGVDTSQTEFDSVEKTGGAKTVTLTTAQIKAPTNRYKMGYDDGGSGAYFGWAPTGHYSANGSSTYKLTAADFGGQPHNNLPPYITTYIWERTA